MKSSHNQQGSFAVVIIIVIVVLVVLGALGSIFWQNYTKQMGDAALEADKKTQQSVESEREADALKPENVNLNTINSSTGGGYSLTLKYPSSWKGEEVNGEDVITSPEGDVTLKYGVATPASFGATCGEQATVQSSEWSALEGFPKGMFSALVWRTSGNVYMYQFGMVDAAGGVDKLKAGDSTCEVGPVQAVVLSTSPKTVIAYANVEFTALSGDTALTAETIKTALTSDNAIIAKRIVESVIVK